MMSNFCVISTSPPEEEAASKDELKVSSIAHPMVEIYARRHRQRKSSWRGDCCRRSVVGMLDGKLFAELRGQDRHASGLESLRAARARLAIVDDLISTSIAPLVPAPAWVSVARARGR